MSNDFLSAFLSPQDLGQFQQTALQADPFAIAGSAIGQWQPNYTNMNAGQGAATAFGRAFMQGILSNYGQNRVADQVSKVVGVLPQMQQDPINMAVPEGINENAFNILKGNAILKKAQRDALLGDQTRVNVADMLKTVLGEGVKSGMITPIEALQAMTTGDFSKIGATATDPNLNPNNPAYKVNQDRMSLSDSLRKELNANKEVADFNVVKNQLSVLEKAKLDPRSVSDLDFIYGTAKILDPGAVVRESDAGLVIESTSLPASTLGYLNKMISGESALSTQQREALVDLAKRHYQTKAERVGGILDTYSTLATKRGLDPVDVLPYNKDFLKMPEFKLPPLSKELYMQMRKQGMSPEEIKSKYGM